MPVEVPDEVRQACRKARLPVEVFDSFYETCPEIRLWRHRDRDENMLAAHEAGWSTQSIAHELGVSLRTVQLGIRRARTAEVADTPEARQRVLRRMMTRARQNKPATGIEFLKIVMTAERKVSALLGPRPAPAYTTLAHGFEEYARQWKETQQARRSAGDEQDCGGRKNGAIAAQ